MYRAAIVRYAGLAGSLLLAVAAYRGGAHSPWHPTMTPTTILRGDNGVLVPVTWLAGTLLLVGAWCAGRRVVPSARWAYVTAALWILPLVLFLPLGSYDVYSYACQGWQQAAGLDPYAGGVDVVGCPWHAAVAPTWLSSPAPYGPVFLLLAALAAKAGGSLAGTIAALRVVALLGVALIGVALPPLARRAGVPLGRAVWLALACPLVAIHLVSGAHNDAVMVGFLVAGLALAADRRLLLAGLLLGLAVGVKATAIVVVPFAILLAVRLRPAADSAGVDRAHADRAHADRADAARVDAGRADADRSGAEIPGAEIPGAEIPGAEIPGAGPAGWVSVAKTDLKLLVRPTATMVAGVIGVLAVVSLVSGRGLGWVTGLRGSEVSVQWTSPPTAVGMAIRLAGPNAVPGTRLIGIALLAVVLVVLWWRARRGEPLRYAGLALAATVALAPVFHPWYATWPLAVLAATVRRETLWLVIPPAVAAALCLPDGYNLALATKSQGAILMTAFIILVTGKTLYDTKSRNGRVAGPLRGHDRLSRRDA
jgi:alpha-1,6-mannosyltransferase